MIQQIIDAVINQGSLKSLNVLGFLLIAMSIAQAILSALRTFLFSDTTNKIDASLGSSIVNHLLRLPIQYFSKRILSHEFSIQVLQVILIILTYSYITLLIWDLYFRDLSCESEKYNFKSMKYNPIFHRFGLRKFSCQFKKNAASEIRTRAAWVTTECPIH